MEEYFISKGRDCLAGACEIRISIGAFYVFRYNRDKYWFEITIHQPFFTLADSWFTARMSGQGGFYERRKRYGKDTGCSS